MFSSLEVSNIYNTKNVEVVEYISLASRCCGFESCQELMILACEETTQKMLRLLNTYHLPLVAVGLNHARNL